LQPRLGTFALWFGWYGFNPGSTLAMHDYATGAMAAQVAMNTTLSAATGGITVFILAYVITKKYDVGGLCNGILAGRRLLESLGGFLRQRYFFD
jgi:Amt family ammonium transporter